MKTKILYVEDEPSLGRIVMESLQSRDFSVTMVTDGASAISRLREAAPHLCILDVMLPGKDGYSIAREIRQVQPDLPIIFVTAKVQTEDVLKGFDVGGNDYLKKPFSLEELIARVNNLLQLTKTASNQKPAILSLGRFEFDPNRYELRTGDKLRKLSHRESTLLQLLSQNINATTQRKDILMTLWGDDSFFNSRNLDVYIVKLREYLREDPQIEIITIKGVGYHFSVQPFQQD